MRLKRSGGNPHLALPWRFQVGLSSLCPMMTYGYCSETDSIRRGALRHLDAAVLQDASVEDIASVIPGECCTALDDHELAACTADIAGVRARHLEPDGSLLAVERLRAGRQVTTAGTGVDGQHEQHDLLVPIGRDQTGAFAHVDLHAVDGVVEVRGSVVRPELSSLRTSRLIPLTVIDEQPFRVLTGVAPTGNGLGNERGHVGLLGPPGCDHAATSSCKRTESYALARG